VGVRFPWGSSLALRCGSLSAPLDVASGGRSPACAIVAFESGCLHCDPGHSRSQGGGGSTKLFAVASFSRSRRGAPLRPAPFRAPRMRTPRGPSRSLKSLHRIVSTSDVLYVTGRHTRVGILVRPTCCPSSRSSRMVMRILPTSQRAPLRLAGESKAGKSPRTPFVVSRTCKPKPAGHVPGNLLGTVHTRTVSPSVHPRPASGGATDFFLASALCSPTGLATSRWRRRAMRPTDVCHPIELRAPAPRAFPARSRSFRCADAPWSLGLHATLPGE
jgi:hypothetical protein